MDYEEFIRYVVIVSMVALPRHQLWSDILNGSEILEVLHTDQATKQYALSFYNSHFDKVCSIDNENSWNMISALPRTGLCRTGSQE